MSNPLDTKVGKYMTVSDIAVIVLIGLLAWVGVTLQGLTNRVAVLTERVTQNTSSLEYRIDKLENNFSELDQWRRSIEIIN